MYYNDYLAHHGILGMKWGVRRYQNKDGSYTNAGKKRYQDMTPSEKRAYSKRRRERNEKIKAGLKLAASVAAIGGVMYLNKKADDAYRESGSRAKSRAYRAHARWQYEYERGRQYTRKHAQDKYANAKVYSPEQAKAYLDRIMSRAAKMEANGGMDIDMKNSVLRARDMYKRAKAAAQ